MRASGQSLQRFQPHRVAAKAVAAAGLMIALLAPAQAQFWGSWGGPPRQQQQYSPFGGWLGGDRDYRPREREREAPADYSRAPAPPRKQDATVTTPVVVLGDAMADWLAYGLEEAFAEKPEIGIVRKHRTSSGLIRYEPRRDTEWAQVAREIITAEKPKFIIMLIGVNDRQSIRERAPATPNTPAQRGAAGRQPAAAPPPTAQPDPELQAQQSADQQNAELQDSATPPMIAAPEPARGASGPFEFHTEKWEAAYVKRIDATIAALKSAGVPVLWVGLPAQRGSRATSDSAYLNDLFRQRAEKAGIVYVDVWDGFVDDAGRFTVHGPDFEGQTRRLRSGDGIYFTKAGARKLAHYVERELQRNIANRAIPVALPAPEPAVQAPGARSSGPAPRPVAGPVVPLTASTSGSDELLGSGRAARPSPVDPVATRVLTKGEPINGPTGRADDFSWPRSNVVTVEPVSAPATAAPGTRPGTSTAPGAAAPARARPAANASTQRENVQAPGAEATAPVRRRSRPPVANAAPRDVSPRDVAPRDGPARDDVPRPPGLIGR
jgi:hypothetical protein